MAMQTGASKSSLQELSGSIFCEEQATGESHFLDLFSFLLPAACDVDKKAKDMGAIMNHMRNLALKKEGRH